MSWGRSALGRPAEAVVVPLRMPAAAVMARRFRRHASWPGRLGGSQGAEKSCRCGTLRPRSREWSRVLWAGATCQLAAGCRGLLLPPRGLIHAGGNTHDEAEGKPRVALDDMAADIAAVVAPADNALVALHVFAERVLAAREDDTHGSGLVRDSRASVVSVERFGSTVVRELWSLRCLW